MEKKKIKLEIRKVGTFRKSVVKAAALDTGDPTSTMTSTTTTLGDMTTTSGFHRDR